MTVSVRRIQVDLYKQVDGVKSFVKTYSNRWHRWFVDVQDTSLPLSEGGKQITYLADVSMILEATLKIRMAIP